MNRVILTVASFCLLPWLSGCCCCGPTTACGGYDQCVPYGTGGYSGGSGCGCEGENFSLPPEGTIPQNVPNSAGGTWSNGTWYGPETIGPEVVGPEYVPNGSEWQTAPPVPGSYSPVTPANPGTPGPNASMPPMPVPGVFNGSNGIPSPTPPYSPASSTQSSGPMVPPPPAEPISQMRFRQYR